MKVCTRCLVEKAESDFYENATSRDGYRQPCKSCIADWHRNHRNEIRTGKRDWGDPLVNMMMRKWR